MKLYSLEIPVFQHALHWYEHFFSEVLDVELEIGQSGDHSIIKASVSSLELMLNPQLVKKSDIPMRLTLHEGQSKGEVAQKLELFLYKYRKDVLNKDVSYFSMTTNGQEKLVLKDPCGHEWLWH